MWHTGQGAAERLLPLVIRNCADTAEHRVCKIERSKATQCSVMSVYRTYVFEHLFWQLYGPNFQLPQIALYLFLSLFFFCVTGAGVNPQVSDIHSKKKSFPCFKVFEPTSRINVLIYFERWKGPAGIHRIMTWNSDSPPIWMGSKRCRKWLWYPHRQIPNFNLQYAMSLLSLRKVAFSSTKIKATHYILNAGS